MDQPLVLEPSGCDTPELDRNSGDTVRDHPREYMIPIGNCINPTSISRAPSGIKNIEL